jgi:hypothetical protein
MRLLPRRRKSALQPKPWLKPKDGKKVVIFRLSYPTSVASLVFVNTRDGGNCLLQSAWRGEAGLPVFNLQRKIENPREDWAYLVRLACWVGGHSTAHCATIQQAISSCKCTQSCKLTITPTSFTFKEHADAAEPVTLAGGKF